MNNTLIIPSIPKREKVTKMLDINNERGSNLINYKGSFLVYNIFYLYLLKKYKSNCTLFSDTLLDNTISGLIVALDITTLMARQNELKEQNKEIAEQLSRCIKLNNKIIIIPLTLYKLNSANHKALLIYREKDNVIEYFEPYLASNRTKDFNTLVKAQLQLFVYNVSAFIKRQLIFKNSNELCLHINGLQEIEESIPRLPNDPGGYCTIWSLFFAELVLSNPNLTTEEILNIIFDKLNKNKNDSAIFLRKIARGYVNLINDKINKYFSIFLELENITIDKLITQGEVQRKFKTIMAILLSIEVELARNNNDINAIINAYNDGIDNIKAQLKSNIPLNEKVALNNELQTIELAKQIITSKYNILFENITPLTITPKTITPKKNSSQIQNQPQIKIEKICPPGKVLNPKTNRCIKIKNKKQFSSKNKTPLQIEKICPPGKVLNPKTNRCIKNKIPLQIEKICPPGKVLNTKTNRCIKIKKQISSKNKVPLQIEKICPPGKVLNPKTNRCIKIKNKK